MHSIRFVVVTIDLDRILRGFHGWEALDQERKSLMIELASGLIQSREIRLPGLEALHRVKQANLKPRDHESAEKNEPALLCRWHELPLSDRIQDQIDLRVIQS